MSYNKLLKKIIAESGYTSKDIVEEFNKREKSIDKAYLSKLLNNKLPPPSEEVSRTISQICGVDERLLILEGYMEKAPKEIRGLFESMKMNISMMALGMMENIFDDTIIEQLKKQMQREPISDFIIQYTDNQNSILSLKNNLPQLSMKDNDVTLNVSEPLSLPIQDNAMYPIIPEGSKVIFKVEEKYNNGDLLVMKLKDKNSFIARYVLFNNDDVTLTSINKQFKPITYIKEDVSIIGKATKVIIDL